MMSLRTPFPSTSPTQCQSTFYTATPRRLGKENSSSKPASSIIEEIFDDVGVGVVFRVAYGIPVYSMILILFFLPTIYATDETSTKRVVRPGR